MTNDSNPQEWKECKLSEVARLVKDTYKPKTGDHLPYIGLEHIQEQGLRLLSIGDSDSVTSQKFYFKYNDVLFGKLRPYFRKVVKPNFAGVCSTDIWVVRAVEGNDQDFIFYFFANQELVDTANSGDSGTRMPRADWHFVKDTIWQFPPLPEQRAIAGVLSSLDDKIDLLHRQNKTLEGMAEALWRKMFVEEGTNTRIVNLSEIIEIHDSKRIPLSSMQRERMKNGVLYPYYGAATIMDYINQYIFDGEYLLLGEDGTVETDDGYPVLQLATGKFWVNNHTHVLRAKKPFSNFLLYIILRNTSISHIVTGAVQPKINQENLKSLEISSSKDIIVDELSVVADNFWQKIQANNLQIDALSRLRDTLLPKLMSGEICISNNEELIDNASQNVSSLDLTHIQEVT